MAGRNSILPFLRITLAGFLHFSEQLPRTSLGSQANVRCILNKLTVSGLAGIALHRDPFADVFHSVNRWASASEGPAMQSVEGANSSPADAKRLLCRPNCYSSSRNGNEIGRKSHAA